MRSIYTLSKSGKTMPEYMKTTVWQAVRDILSLSNSTPSNNCIIYLYPSDNGLSYFYLIKKARLRGSRPVHFKITPIVHKILESLEGNIEENIYEYISSFKSVIIAQISCNEENCLIKLLKGEPITFEQIKSEFKLVENKINSTKEKQKLRLQNAR